MPQVKKKIKSMVESLNLEYRARLALAKEEMGGIKASIYLSNMNRIEGQRQLSKNSRHLKGGLKEEAPHK